MDIHKEAWAITESKLSLIDVTGVRKGQYGLLIGSPVDLVIEHFRLIFTIETEVGVFTPDTLSFCYCCFTCLMTVNVSVLFISLRSLIAETCSRINIVARIWSQNDLGQKWLHFGWESYAQFSSSRDPSPCVKSWCWGNIVKKKKNKILIPENLWTVQKWIEALYIFKSVFEHTSIWVRQCQTESSLGHSTATAKKGFYREDKLAKQECYLTVSSLSGCFTWEIPCWLFRIGGSYVSFSWTLELDSNISFDC